MKNIGTILLLLLFALTACTNEEEFSLLQPGGNESGTTTCRMMFYGDVTGYGGATRAGGHEWKEGDRLYIRFLGDGSTVTGCAVYSLDNEWTLNLGGSLAASEGQKCEVYYFENATHKSDTVVELTAHSAVYECLEGSYSYNGTGMFLSAQLSPKTGRVRFVSDSERPFWLSGISYYTSFNSNSKDFTSSSAKLELSTVQLGTEYSTGYIYGFYTDKSESKLTLVIDKYYMYLRKFPLSMLQTGMSGYITVPDANSYGGWERRPVTGTLNGHGWVDLGLPSGLKWATCNVGASNPEGYGNYYAWGETSTKSDYSSSTSITYGVEVPMYIGGNAQYDVACKMWGSTWRLPNEREILDLGSNCTWEWTTQSGTNGYKVTSEVNGASIFLPAAGYRDGTGLYDDGTVGYYWSSSMFGDENAKRLQCESGFVPPTILWDSYRYYGHSVRPVCE